MPLWNAGDLSEAKCIRTKRLKKQNTTAAPDRSLASAE